MTDENGTQILDDVSVSEDLPDKPVLKLYAAMRKARAMMGPVAKSGHNDFDNYDYSELSDFIDVTEKPCDECGLLVVNHVESIRWEDDRVTSGGKTEKVCRIMMRVTVIHVDSGESMSTVALGEGQDRADKASYKANTGARKYGLANLFNLATKDDPEVDSPQAAVKVQQKKPPTGTAAAGVAAQKTVPQNFALPANWPDTDLINLGRYIDQIDTTPWFTFALGLFNNEPSLKVDFEEWGQILDALASSYKRRITMNPRVKNDALTNAIKNALDKYQLEKQALEVFPPPETKATEVATDEVQDST